jgi:hypothetical protein
MSLKPLSSKGNQLMTTLRIEHAIHDYDLWRSAFDGFAVARSKAGVQSYAIHRPVDDQHYLYLDLEFADRDRAQAFAAFLRETVWSNPAASPGLAGQPRTRLLELQPERRPEPQAQVEVVV